MATASKITERVEKVVQVEEVTGVTLQLSLEEARALFIVCGNISGHPQNSLRKYTSAIYGVLSGVQHPKVSGYIGPGYFHNNSIHALDKEII